MQSIRTDVIRLLVSGLIVMNKVVGSKPGKFKQNDSSDATKRRRLRLSLPRRHSSLCWLSVLKLLQEHRQTQRAHPMYEPRAALVCQDFTNQIVNGCWTSELSDTRTHEIEHVG
jgi:hypothetical protein